MPEADGYPGPLLAAVAESTVTVECAA